MVGIFIEFDLGVDCEFLLPSLTRDEDTVSLVDFGVVLDGFAGVDDDVDFGVVLDDFAGVDFGVVLDDFAVVDVDFGVVLDDFAGVDVDVDFGVVFDDFAGVDVDVDFGVVLDEVFDFIGSFCFAVGGIKLQLSVVIYYSFFYIYYTPLK